MSDTDVFNHTLMYVVDVFNSMTYRNHCMNSLYIFLVLSQQWSSSNDRAEVHDSLILFLQEMKVAIAIHIYRCLIRENNSRAPPGNGIATPQHQSRSISRVNKNRVKSTVEYPPQKINYYNYWWSIITRYIFAWIIDHQ